ncbi:MAG: DUF418 domain-containing protein [Pseudomonadota bacterium]
MVMPPRTPTTSSMRILELDALRGLAVVGIVWMNVYVFALPFQAYVNPSVWGWETPIDRWVWTASFVFVEDKFRTLFAILFGAGCLILVERAEAEGDSRVWRAHFARMAVLFMIGIAHSVLLASNDVLRAYAVAGLAIPVLASLSHRALFAIAIGLVVVHVGGGMVAFGTALIDFYAGRTGSAIFLSAQRQFGGDPGALEYAIRLGQEGFGERVLRRIDGIPSQLRLLAASIPINLAAMALGMALWKCGLLKGEWRTFQLQRLAAICAVLAIPALLGLSFWTVSSEFASPVAALSALILSTPFDTLLGLSYAALAMAFFGPGGAVSERLAKIGRLSLTNYLMTSLVLAAIFASWGMGLFGQVSRAEAFTLGFVPTILMALWSPWWLARLGQGPAERLWRWTSARLS